jgi:hypothetical protein
MDKFVSDLGFNLISNVSLEIGGGKGWWCRKCNKLYRNQPSKNFTCHNIYEETQLNHAKLIELIHQLGEVSDEVIRQYIDDPSQSFPEIDEIFQSEKQSVTYEEYSDDYTGLMDLLLERYKSEIYDTVTIECDSHEYVYEERRGREIDSYNPNMMNMINSSQKLSSEKLIPLKFWFCRDTSYPSL